MKRGPKASPNSRKIVRGTFRSSRSTERTVPALAGVPVKPGWLLGDAARIWTMKVATYARRGQSVTGCEGPLAQYCRLEADVVTRWHRDQEVPSALLNAYRSYAAEFYDTPASQRAARSTTAGANPFASHGRAPGDAGGR